MTYAESNYLGSAIATNNQASFTFSYLDVSEIRVDITVNGTTTTYTTSSSPAGFSINLPSITTRPVLAFSKIDTIF